MEGFTSEFIDATVTLGFFDDIVIPPESLQHPSRFDEGEQLWIWEYETEDGKHDLFMDPGWFSAIEMNWMEWNRSI